MLTNRPRSARFKPCRRQRPRRQHDVNAALLAFHLDDDLRALCPRVTLDLRIPLEIQLRGQGDKDRVYHREVDVRRTQLTRFFFQTWQARRDVVAAWHDRFKHKLALVVGFGLATQVVVGGCNFFIRMSDVISAFGIGLPNIDHRTSDGGLAIRCKYTPGDNDVITCLGRFGKLNRGVAVLRRARKEERPQDIAIGHLARLGCVGCRGNGTDSGSDGTCEQAAATGNRVHECLHLRLVAEALEAAPDSNCAKHRQIK
jgi:hypothetical protein